MIYIKTLVINSYQRINDSRNKEKIPKLYKHQQINDEERQDLPADYENNRYIPFLPLKKSNRPLNLGVKTRSLTYLVSIKSKK